MRWSTFGKGMLQGASAVLGAAVIADALDRPVRTEVIEVRPNPFLPRQTRTVVVVEEERYVVAEIRQGYSRKYSVLDTRYGKVGSRTFYTSYSCQDKCNDLNRERIMDW